MMSAHTCPFARAPRTRPRTRTRSGAGLVEIMLAMVIFALVATSYAAVTLRYATRMKTIAAGAARSAVLSENMNFLMALPFSSLAGLSSCVTAPTTAAFPYTCAVSVSGSTTAKTITLTLTPANAAILPDVVVLTRVFISNVNPLT